MSQKDDNGGSDFKVDPNAWMATFADLIMLLLTFFVLLLTMKSMDAGKVKEMFVRAYGPLDYVQQREEVMDAINFVPNIKSLTITSTASLEEAIDLLEGVATPERKGKPKVGLRDIAEISETEQGVIISVGADNLFDSGEAEIRPDRLYILDEIARLFQYATNDVLVMGHTDDVPVKKGGRFASNLDLSACRALNVLYYLVDSRGLQADHLAAGGYGDVLPRYPNDNPKDRAKNRRVEFIIKKAN
jgi:chemotaxis protein MotB